MNYSGISGASDKAIATMMQYGMLERVATGEARVSQTAIDILYPENPEQKRTALLTAAYSPPLFRSIRERFSGDQPSETSLRSWLLREGFNDRAINPIIKSYSQTCSYLRQENAIESAGEREPSRPKSQTPEDDEVQYGGARVGDLIQWESQGVLQFQTPIRVRLVSEDGEWIAVEGSETGIPMNEVIVEERAGSEPKRQAPTFALQQPPEPSKEEGEVEWMRNILGPETRVRVMVKGDMSAKEIGKLIRLLKAQRAVLLDDDEDDENEAA